MNYSTAATFEAQNPTLTILKIRRTAYPNLLPQESEDGLTYSNVAYFKIQHQTLTFLKW